MKIELDGDPSDYIEVLDDFFLIYVESDFCGNATQEERCNVTGRYYELKLKLLQAQKKEMKQLASN
jgi:hypothetical protein